MVQRKVQKCVTSTRSSCNFCGAANICISSMHHKKHCNAPACAWVKTSLCPNVKAETCRIPFPNPRDPEYIQYRGLGGLGLRGVRGLSTGSKLRRVWEYMMNIIVLLLPLGENCPCSHVLYTSASSTYPAKPSGIPLLAVHLPIYSGALFCHRDGERVNPELQTPNPQPNPEP